MSEQQADFVRQRELKYLAQAADERWAAKPSVLDRPRREALQAGKGDNDIKADGANSVERKKQIWKETEDNEAQKRNPWRAKQGNPGERWQPEAWAPAAKK